MQQSAKHSKLSKRRNAKVGKNVQKYIKAYNDMKKYSTLFKLMQKYASVFNVVM